MFILMYYFFLVNSNDLFVYLYDIFANLKHFLPYFLSHLYSFSLLISIVFIFSFICIVSYSFKWLFSSFSYLHNFSHSFLCIFPFLCIWIVSHFHLPGYLWLIWMKCLHYFPPYFHIFRSYLFCFTHCDNLFLYITYCVCVIILNTIYICK